MKRRQRLLKPKPMEFAVTDKTGCKLFVLKVPRKLAVDVRQVMRSLILFGRLPKEAK